jgi:class 3 adenylate cyclase
VNTAARLQQECLEGQVNISATTHELVKDRFTCWYRGEIEAKHKGALKMFFVEPLNGPRTGEPASNRVGWLRDVA